MIEFISNIIRRTMLDAETEKYRNQYYLDAEEAIKVNDHFNWLTAKIAIFQMRRARYRMETMLRFLTDSNFHKAVSTYTEAISPIVEKIVDEEGERLMSYKEQSIELPDSLIAQFKQSGAKA